MATIGQQLLAPEAGMKRIDSTNPSIKYRGTWSERTVAGSHFNGTFSEGGINASLGFNFKSTRLTILNLVYTDTADALLDIDGVKYNYLQYGNPQSQTVSFSIDNLDSNEHICTIYQKTSSGNGLRIDAIDIDSTGSILPYNDGRTKTSTSQMKLGDRIAIEYTASSNTFGIFANMGKATKPELPLMASATPDGTFYLYHVGYNFQGKMILVPDRNIQHSISWDTLNTAGVASGSGLPIKIDNKDCVVRLMTGGISATDKDNEWDKIIAESTLGGTITAGDSTVWNYSGGVLTWCSTSISGGGALVGRGGSLASSWGTYSNSAIVYDGVGFRPVFLVEPNNAHYLFLKDDYTCHSWDGIALTKVSNDWRQETFATQMALFLAGTQSVPIASILQPLLKCKVMVYSDDTAMGKPTGSISAVPHKFFIKPKNLISLASFEGVDNASLTSTVSGTGACKILVTTDLVNYKTWNGTSWAIVDTSDLLAIVSNGLTPSALSSVPRSAWDSLTGGKGGIAFGYLPTIESVSDSAAVDGLLFTVDMKGSWDKAVHGIDYGYGYPQNNILRVTLKTNGDYKINYSEGCVSQ